MQSLWDGLGAPDADTPSAALRNRFERMLDGEIAAAHETAALESAAPIAGPRAARSFSPGTGRCAAASGPSIVESSAWH